MSLANVDRGGDTSASVGPMTGVATGEDEARQRAPNLEEDDWNEEDACWRLGRFFVGQRRRGKRKKKKDERKRDHERTGRDVSSSPLSHDARKKSKPSGPTHGTWLNNLVAECPGRRPPGSRGWGACRRGWTGPLGREDRGKRGSRRRSDFWLVERRPARCGGGAEGGGVNLHGWRGREGRGSFEKRRGEPEDRARARGGREGARERGSTRGGLALSRPSAATPALLCPRRSQMPSQRDPQRSCLRLIPVCSRERVAGFFPFPQRLWSKCPHARARVPEYQRCPSYSVS